ncbi:hypothetical protein ACLKA7_011849 [Drosophila subpalustris]
MSLYSVKTPRAGAQTQLRLALDPALENSSGGYYSDSLRFPLLAWVRDMNTANWLWRENEKLVGLPPIKLQAAHDDESIKTVVISE